MVGDRRLSDVTDVEHETFFEVCKEICRRPRATYHGSLIERFHDMQTWWNALLDHLSTSAPAPAIQ